VVGIDEAGRGSVLGPLVVGAFCYDDGRSDELAATGVRDSKQLTPRRREEIRAHLDALGDCRSVPLPPRTIDAYVAHGGLNELELETFAALVREFRPDVAYVDACDPNAVRFGERLRARSRWSGRVVSRHRADAELLVVGAASIVAKVARDAELAALRASMAEAIGSGYPSDPETRACVERHAADGGAIPPWMRRSWATVKRVKRDRPASTLDRYAP
jgi:ribonuclease HII